MKKKKMEILIIICLKIKHYNSKVMHLTMIAHTEVQEKLIHQMKIIFSIKLISYP
jgi:hypothetical protein